MSTSVTNGSVKCSGVEPTGVAEGPQEVGNQSADAFAQLLCERLGNGVRCLAATSHPVGRSARP